MILALLACGAELSNEVFLEDADFLAALPSREVLVVGYPGSPGCEAVDDDDASLYALSLCAMEGTDDLLALVAATTEVVRNVAPTERDTDYRRWGPGAWDLVPGAYLTAEMTRSSTGAYYTWTFSVAEDEAGPWEVLLDGHHYGGAVEVAAGRGAFSWDVEQQYRFDDQPGVGLVTVSYDRTADLELLLEAEEVAIGVGASPASADWWYTATDEGDGAFEYQSADSFGAGVVATVRTRFDVDGAGRGDAVVNGGAEVNYVQCWGGDGALAWQWDAWGASEEVGSEGACAFDDAEQASHLP